MISIEENLNKLKKQKEELLYNILRIEGSISTLEEFKRLGVTEIPVQENEVIDYQEEST